ncbi:MAG: phosphate ABC transporter ATP-binding protein [Candidatus Paceibacterota bacterium]|jgi:phosphate transport system ATP-binding protein
MHKTVISVRSLNIWYSDFHAIKNVNMDLPENQITALIGASGSGKSTFLRSLNRMLDIIPSAKIEGDVIFKGENILDQDSDVVSLRRKIGMVFQNSTPFPKSIFENIAYGLELQGIKKESRGFWKMFSNQKYDSLELEKSSHPLDKAVVKSLKEAALWKEVKDRLHQSAFRLSGGQQQRLCIARSLAVKPEVLLLDEPCSELDPISTRKIEELLTLLKEKYTIVIVTHNLYQAKRISDHVGFFHMGELMEFGSAKDIFEHPNQPITKEYVCGGFG